MKNILNFLFVISITFISCQKEERVVPDNPQTTVEKPKDVSPIGYDWELYSGRVFVTNIDNNATFYYDHFGPNKNVSNLDIFSPSTLPFDIINKGLTKWKFTSSNQFILDGGSTYTFSLNVNNIYRVYGMENGSSRIIEILNCTADYMNVKVLESSGSDGTFNYSFYTVLTFIKVGSTVTPVATNAPYGYTYNGVLGNSTTTTTTLVNTKWVVNKFIQNFVSTFPSDTLEFVSNTQYTINRSTARNYNVSSIVGSTMKSLSLYSFTTLGGDWSGQVQGTFINDWVINNASFTNIMNTSLETRVWLTRIQ